MRTKYLFFSTILAVAALSSCSNEDFVENAGIETGGEKVAISITATKGSDDASTRTGINVGTGGALGSQYWEKSDKLGGLLYTAEDGSAMLTNYPFVPTDEKAFENGGKPTVMSFKTPTAVSKGTYVFYTPYDTKHVGNGTFEVELSDRQEMDPADPTAHLGKNNFMISPAISLAGIPYGEEGALNELPIQFRSIYNLTRISIKLDQAKAPVTIQRIIIKDGSGVAFKTNSQIVPSDINTLVKTVAEEWSDGETVGSTEILTNKGELDASKAVAADYQQAAKALEVQEKHVEQTEGAPAIVLAVKGGKTLKAGETFDAYVLLPAGKYDDGLAYDIYTDKGVSSQSIVGDGWEGLTAAKSKKISCTLNYTTDGNNIVLPTKFEIASDQDWKDAVDYVTTNFGSYGSAASWNTPTFTLLKDVKGTLPADFKVAVETGDNKLTLEGNNALGTIEYVLKDANIINEGTLTVAGGTTAKTAEWTVKSLENKGIVTVGATAKLITTTTFTNLGSLTNAGGVEVKTTTTNGKVDGTVEATITNAGKFTSTGALTNYEGGVINVNKATNATFTLGAESSSAGEINIADGATLTASTAALTNTGTITLNGAAELDGGISALINVDGTIIITDPAKEYKLTVPASNGIIKTTVSTLEGITAAQDKVGADADELINTIELTSSIKIEDNLALTDVDLYLAENVKLEIANTKIVTCANMFAAGANTSVVPYDANDASSTTAAATVAAGAIEIANGASLTIAKGIKVGDACVALTVGKNAALTNNGEIKAGSSNEDVTVSVEAGGTLTNAKTGTMTNAVLDIKKNAGSIVNSSETPIQVKGGMVGSMNGAFTFTAAP